MTIVSGAMRTEENGINLTANPIEFLPHALVDSVKGIDAEEPPCDA
jgi:hypothetical protein